MGKKNKLFRERMRQTSKKDIEEIAIEDHYKNKKQQQAKEMAERETKNKEKEMLEQEQKNKIEELKQKEVKVEKNLKENNTIKAKFETETKNENEIKAERSGYAKNVIARREAQEAEQKRKDAYQKVVYEKLRKMDEDRLR